MCRNHRLVIEVQSHTSPEKHLKINDLTIVRCFSVSSIICFVPIDVLLKSTQNICWCGVTCSQPTSLFVVFKDKFLPKYIFQIKSFAHLKTA